jgi:hypothetical protein
MMEYLIIYVILVAVTFVPLVYTEVYYSGDSLKPWVCCQLGILSFLFPIGWFLLVRFWIREWKAHNA